jgi:hypothetical protein
LHGIGLASFHLRKYEEAIKDFTSAISKDPNDPLFHSKLDNIIKIFARSIIYVLQFIFLNHSKLRIIIYVFGRRQRCYC